MSESFGIIRPRSTIITDYGWSAPVANAAPVWNATDHLTQNTSSTTVTFTGANIGTASSDRVVVVLLNTASAFATGLTIGGVTATKDIEEGGGISALQIWSANVPSGATANIVVTSGSAMNNESIIVGVLTGVTVAHSSVNSVAPTSADPSSISVTVPSTGFGIVGLYGVPGLAGGWTGATEDFRITDSNGNLLVMAHASATGTVQASGFSGGSYHQLSASWGP